MSKVRLVVELEGRTFYGAHVYTRVKQFAEAYRVPRLPEELRRAPKWQRIIWKFEQLPVPNKKLFVFREPRRVHVNQSRYVNHLLQCSTGRKLKRRNWRKPPAPRPRQRRPGVPEVPREPRFFRDPAVLRQQRDVVAVPEPPQPAAFWR